MEDDHEQIDKGVLKFQNDLLTRVPDVQIPDPDGFTINLHEYEGCYYPAMTGVHERLRTITDLKLRPDDVYLCSYPKSGAHWHYELCKMIAHQTSQPLTGAKGQLTVDMVPEEMLEFSKSPRFLNSHFHPQYLPRDVTEGRNKLIYIVRNPKDAAVSFYHLTKGFHVGYNYDGKWSGYFELYIQGKVDYGSWFEYTLAWEKFIENHPKLQILKLHYEDTKENPTEQVHRIAEFLDKPCSESLLESIADAGGFAKLRESKAGGTSEIEKISAQMFRKGEVGDWRNWFTVAQNEKFDQIYAERMKDSGVKVRYEL